MQPSPMTMTTAFPRAARINRTTMLGERGHTRNSTGAMRTRDIGTIGERRICIIMDSRLMIILSINPRLVAIMGTKINTKEAMMIMDPIEKEQKVLANQKMNLNR